VKGMPYRGRDLPGGGTGARGEPVADASAGRHHRFDSGLHTVKGASESRFARL
jgi:hypothetical protein